MTKEDKIASAVCLMLVLGLGSCVAQTNLRAHRLGNLTPGMTKKEVLNLVGKPATEDPCGKNFGPHGGPDCKTELVYDTAGGWVPGVYLVLLDKNDKVVGQVDLESP